MATTKTDVSSLLELEVVWIECDVEVEVEKEVGESRDEPWEDSTKLCMPTVAVSHNLRSRFLSYCTAEHIIRP